MPFESTYKQYGEYTDQNLDRYAEGFSQYEQDAVIGTEYFENMVAEAVRVAEERDVELYCGEYGVVDRADPQDIVRWYRMIHETFEKYGIGRAAWNYRGKDFGFVDEHMSVVLEEVISLL